MIQNKTIHFVSKNPYLIFKIPDFLNYDFYNKLRTNFPDLASISNDNLVKFENKKFALNSDSKKYQQFINENNIYKKFNDFVFSEDFFYFLIKKFYLNFIFSRGFDLKHLIKISKIPRLNNNYNNYDEKKKILKYFSIFKDIDIKLKISLIKNTGSIVPHADAGDKLLTLMLYFPDNSLSPEEKQKELDYGTTFFSIKKKTITNKHLDIQSVKNFYLENKDKMILSQFTENTLVGFVKNMYSWHAVKSNDVNTNYVRKSININLYY